MPLKKTKNEWKRRVKVPIKSSSVGINRHCNTEAKKHKNS